MNYDLKKIEHKTEGYMKRLISSTREFLSYLDRRKIGFALILVVIGSLIDIATPYLLGTAIDRYISVGNLKGLSYLILFMFILYLIGSALSYFEQNIIGQAGQSALFNLRNTIFEKLQSLPLEFYSQNNAGDLMSRLNNDTEKISEFLSQSVSQAVGSAAMLLGVSGFILYLNPRLGAVLLASAVVLVIFTRFYSPYLEKKSKEASASLGDFTSGVSEQLTNFKAIIAFGRRNFFQSFLEDLNGKIYKRSLISGFMAKIMEPLFDAAGNISQIAVLIYGIYLVTEGQITLGLLISFVAYAVRFYNPLQYFSRLFGEVQVALASWGRIRDLLSLESNLQKMDESKKIERSEEVLLKLDDVSFGYLHENESNDGKDQMVLKKVQLSILKGKTYALVGPTGGGKSTTANLLARLYDPTQGVIYLKGKDIRSYERKELAKMTSVILQEPHLFNGTVAENIRYGNEDLLHTSDEELETLFKKEGLDVLIQRFPEGIKTHVETGGENISIGQKQLISFVRTVLRKPELLILDEATANIDTVTEDILQKLIDKLPNETTKIIIAHRLNTIRKADEILFIGGGDVKEVSDSNEVLELLNTAANN